MKERFFVFGAAFVVSMLAVMTFLHYRTADGRKDGIIKTWINSSGQHGEVIEYVKADTFIVKFQTETLTVRLNAVDTLPIDEPAGRQALNFVIKLIGDQPIRVIQLHRDPDNVLRGEAYNPENLSLNEELMKAGLARYNKPHSPNNPHYQELEDKAKAGSYGIWAQPIATDEIPEN